MVAMGGELFCDGLAETGCGTGDKDVAMGHSEMFVLIFIVLISIYHKNCSIPFRSVRKVMDLGTAGKVVHWLQRHGALHDPGRSGYSTGALLLSG
jgi:hypothetical protein